MARGTDGSVADVYLMTTINRSVGDGSGPRFHLLGPVGVGGDRLAGPKQRAVLAALLLDVGRVVPDERIVDLVWGAWTPVSVRGQLQVHVSELRKAIGPATIRRHAQGYVIDVDPCELDLAVFDGLVAQAAGETQPACRAVTLRRALALWQGDPLGGVTEQLVTQKASALLERQASTMEALYDAELADGRHAQIVGEVRRAAETYPTREVLQAQLIVALHRCGRTAEALETYAAVRDRLIADLGVEPGRLLREAHLSVLRDERTAAGGAPAQLPADVSGFVGRAHELCMMNEVAGEGGAAVVTIVGAAGVGKTTFAVHWAHSVRDRFPDGQLYINLRSFDPAGDGLTPAEVLPGFLQALGVPADGMPRDLPAQTGLLRSLLATRRLLMVLDNARDADQVTALLPGTSGCRVVVTSRSDLSGLVASGAVPVVLPLLDAAEAAALLRGRLGERRIGGQAAAVDRIVLACAGLPIALAIVAARAATRPAFSLAAIADELDAARPGLGGFEGGDPATRLRTVFARSYDALPTPTAGMFRRLPLHPGGDIDAYAGAALCGSAPRSARAALARLADEHLVIEHAPGRFTVHELLRAYAGELGEEDPVDERVAATRRVLEYLTRTAHAAALLLEPRREPLQVGPLPAGVPERALAGREDAERWFAVEAMAVAAGVRRAYQLGLDDLAWRLSWSLMTFLDRHGRWEELLAVQRVALAAAERSSDLAGQAHTHRHLGMAAAQLGRPKEAWQELTSAFDLGGAAGDELGQANVANNLAWLLDQQGRFVEAVVQVERALLLFTRAAHRAGQARSLNALGWLQTRLGDQAAARQNCERALVVLTEIDDRAGQANTWDSLGHIHGRLGDVARAADCYRRSTELFRALGDAFHEADSYGHLGDLCYANGDAVAASDAWRRAYHLLTALGHADAELMADRLTARA